MTRKLLPLMFVFCLLPLNAPAQEKTLKLEGMPDFLARHEEFLQPLNELYDDLESENLPLRDDAGQLLTRRNIEDRRKALNDLLITVHELVPAPQDLVVTTRLFVQTESVSDDLFDLAQISYNNNREELGKRFSDIQITTDQQLELLEPYMLSLAAEKQERLRDLEKENSALKEKLKQAQAPAKDKLSRRQ